MAIGFCSVHLAKQRDEVKRLIQSLSKKSSVALPG
jgi:hypothetical protein